jgi:Trypsin-co-occurring domain 1
VRGLPKDHAVAALHICATPISERVSTPLCWTQLTGIDVVTCNKPWCRLSAWAQLVRWGGEMSDDVADVVFVPVVEITTGREIGWNTNISELLRSRLSDIRAAISAGAESVASSLTSLPTAETWRVKEVSASFGITLAAEAGVLLSKASTEATFDVTITFQRP